MTRERAAVDGLIRHAEELELKTRSVDAGAVEVRERVIFRKRVTTEHQTVEAELRSEHVTVEGDGSATGAGAV